ncbi:MAG: L,D-transpeptidase [Candidatus Altimarinota bacterium]
MENTFRNISRAFIGLTMILGLWFAAPQEHSAYAEEVQESLIGWEFQKNDWIIVNVAENTMQFVREDYSALSDKIRVGSGKNTGKKMYYLGMAYDPATPEKVWEIRAKQQQSWYNVFGTKENKDQLFLRLFEVKGEQRIWTHYGIHTTPDIETIFEQDNGYGSWGCVLTRYDLLKQIEELYELNDKKVKVITTSQPTEQLIALLKAF